MGRRRGWPQPADQWTLEVVLCVVNADDIPVAELPVILNDRTVGRPGVVMKGSDRSNALHASMKLDVKTQITQLSFKFSSTASHYPHDLVPALTFVSSMVEPNRVKVLLGEDRVPLGETLPVPNAALIEDEYVALVRRLARLQQATGMVFTMPAEFSPQDQHDLTEAVALLDGEEIVERWSEASFVLNVTEPRRFLQELRSNAEAASYLIDGEARVTIADHTMPAGKLRPRLPETSVANIDEVIGILEAAEEGSELSVSVTLEARGDKTLRRSLIPR
jgi:hypothetical protein